MRKFLVFLIEEYTHCGRIKFFSNTYIWFWKWSRIYVWIHHEKPRAFGWGSFWDMVFWLSEIEIRIYELLFHMNNVNERLATFEA